MSIGSTWLHVVFCFFFFKQKTAYEIGTGDWSSDVCSSDLVDLVVERDELRRAHEGEVLRVEDEGHVLARVVRQIGRASCRERV